MALRFSLAPRDAVQLPGLDKAIVADEAELGALERERRALLDESLGATRVRAAWISARLLVLRKRRRALRLSRSRKLAERLAIVNGGGA